MNQAFAEKGVKVVCLIDDQHKTGKVAFHRSSFAMRHRSKESGNSVNIVQPIGDQLVKLDKLTILIKHHAK